MAAKEVSSSDSLADRESISTTLNGRPASIGMGGRLASESVAGLARITHRMATLTLLNAAIWASFGRAGRQQIIRRVGGGAGSLVRTSLRFDFPDNRGKYRGKLRKKAAFLIH